MSHVGVLTGDGRMVDASESRGGVVERAVWTSGVVRYGRVPAPGCPRCGPGPRPRCPPPHRSGSSSTRHPRWTARPAAALPHRSARPRSRPEGARHPGADPGKAPATAPSSPSPVSPSAQTRPSSPVARRAAALAKAEAGRTTWTDLALVRTTWQRAGGRALPDSREAVAAQGRRVGLSDARVGDLVVYNAPATHLGTYLGGGLMADASATMGRVVVRPVYATASVRLVRLG